MGTCPVVQYVWIAAEFLESNNVYPKAEENSLNSLHICVYLHIGLRMCKHIKVFLAMLVSSCPRVRAPKIFLQSYF